jgi:hypothetical protein
MKRQGLAMANYDVVFPYDERMRSWLEQQGYPYPGIRSGYRLPTTGDMKWAFRQLDDSPIDYPRLGPNMWSSLDFVAPRVSAYAETIDHFYWDDDLAEPWNETFTFRHGAGLLGMTLIVTLCQRCGQFMLYHDSGYPAIILDKDDDPHVAHELRERAGTQPDSWTWLFQQRHGPRP